MPADLLSRIENASFPLVVSHAQDVSDAIALEAAGMIKAQLPNAEHPQERPTVIFAITPAGRRALNERSRAR